MAADTLTANMTDEELEHHAFQVLARELGLAAYARFLRLFCSGRGDYTADRHKWLSGITLEEIERELLPDPPQTGQAS
jgi:hypothetical protein